MKWWTQLGTVTRTVTTLHMPHEAEELNWEQLAKRKMTHRHWASKTERGCKKAWSHGSWTKLRYPSSFTHLFNIFHLGIMEKSLFYWLQHCYVNGRNVSTYEVIFFQRHAKVDGYVTVQQYPAFTVQVKLHRIWKVSHTADCIPNVCQRPSSKPG